MTNHAIMAAIEAYRVRAITAAGALDPHRLFADDEAACLKRLLTEIESYKEAAVDDFAADMDPDW